VERVEAELLELVPSFESGPARERPLHEWIRATSNLVARALANLSFANCEASARQIIIEPLLPDRTPRRGGRWIDHRQVVEAIFS
jgi:hypothetical protein